MVLQNDMVSRCIDNVDVFGCIAFVLKFLTMNPIQDKNQNRLKTMLMQEVTIFQVHASKARTESSPRCNY